MIDKQTTGIKRKKKKETEVFNIEKLRSARTGRGADIKRSSGRRRAGHETKRTMSAERRDWTKSIPRPLILVFLRPYASGEIPWKKDQYTVCSSLGKKRQGGERGVRHLYQQNGQKQIDRLIRGKSKMKRGGLER